MDLTRVIKLLNEKKTLRSIKGASYYISGGFLHYKYEDNLIINITLDKDTAKDLILKTRQSDMMFDYQDKLHRVYTAHLVLKAWIIHMQSIQKLLDWDSELGKSYEAVVQKNQKSYDDAWAELQPLVKVLSEYTNFTREYFNSSETKSFSAVFIGICHFFCERD